jgi:hypothetical protein
MVMFTNKVDIVAKYPLKFSVALRRGSKHECWNLLVESQCPLLAKRQNWKEKLLRLLK